MIHDKSHVFPSQALTTQEHPASCKRDNAPIFWRWTKNSCQSFSFSKCHLSKMKTSAVNLYCQWPLDNKIKFWDQCLDSSSRCNDQWCCDWQEDLCHAESGQSDPGVGSCWPMRGGVSQARDMLWRVRSLTCCVSRSPCWQEFHVASLTNTASVLLLPSDFLCVFMISSSYKLTHWPQCSARAAHIVNILGRSI